jgi:hypothetical protein
MWHPSRIDVFLSAADTQGNVTPLKDVCFLSANDTQGIPRELTYHYTKKSFMTKW